MAALILYTFACFRGLAGPSNDVLVTVATNGGGATLEQVAKNPQADIFQILKPLQFLLIPLVTVLIQLARKFIPMIPDTYWPFVAPFLGATLDYIAGQTGLWTGNAAVGAMLGGLGTWFHQFQKQAGDPLGKLIPDAAPAKPDNGPALPPPVPTKPIPPVEDSSPGDRIVE